MQFVSFCDSFDFTGCTVAQHCYNGDVSFLWEKMENLTPCKIETLEQIDT